MLVLTNGSIEIVAGLYLVLNAAVFTWVAIDITRIAHKWLTLPVWLPAVAIGLSTRPISVTTSKELTMAHCCFCWHTYFFDSSLALRKYRFSS